MTIPDLCLPALTIARGFSDSRKCLYVPYVRNRFVSKQIIGTYIHTLRFCAIYFHRNFSKFALNPDFQVRTTRYGREKKRMKKVIFGKKFFLQNTYYSSVIH